MRTGTRTRRGLYFIKLAAGLFYYNNNKIHNFKKQNQLEVNNHKFLKGQD